MPFSVPQYITHGDIGQSAMGDFGKVLMDGALSAAQIGFASAYLFFVNKNVGQVFEPYLGEFFLVS